MVRAWVPVAYLIGVMGGAAWLSPWIWWAAHALAEAMPETSMSRWVDHPFSRYVHRCLLVLAVIGLWPLLRASGCRGWRDVGLDGGPGRWMRATAGFGAALGGCLILVAWEAARGQREWKPGLTWNGAETLGSVGTAAITAATVSVVEEVLFRGVLWTGLKSRVGPVGALFVSSGVYAISHGLGRPRLEGDVTWLSGWAILGRMLSGEGSKIGWFPGLGTLFLLGVLFGLSYWREGRLYHAIGLHGGLVFWMKLRGAWTRSLPGSSGSGDPLASGLAFGLAMLAVVWFLSAGWYGRARESTKP